MVSLNSHSVKGLWCPSKGIWKGHVLTAGCERIHLPPDAYLHVPHVPHLTQHATQDLSYTCLVSHLCASVPFRTNRALDKWSKQHYDLFVAFQAAVPPPFYSSSFHSNLTLPLLSFVYYWQVSMKNTR